MDPLMEKKQFVSNSDIKPFQICHWLHDSDPGCGQEYYFISKTPHTPHELLQCNAVLPEGTGTFPPVTNRAQVNLLEMISLDAMVVPQASSLLLMLMSMDRLLDARSLKTDR